MEKVTLTRNEFYKLIWSTPLSKLAKTYALSDNGLRKMCKKYKVPIPPNGYWQKLKFNKPVKPEKLPAFAMGNDAIELPLRGPENPFNLDASPETLLVRQLKADPDAPLTVPQTLTKPHPHTKETKRYWAEQNKRSERYGYGNTMPHLSISTEKANRPRALLFFDTLIKLLEYRCHGVAINERGTFALIGGVEIKLSLREASNRVYNTESRWPTSELVPNGKLILKSGKYSFDKEWRDNKTRLEDMLPRIVARLELDGQKEARWREQAKLAAIEREKEEQRRQEKERLRRAEQARLDTLLAQADNFAKAQKIRALVAETERKALTGGEISQETKQWMDWARAKADWYDPTIAAPDSILDD